MSHAETSRSAPIQWLNNLRAIATIAVIILHVSAIPTVIEIDTKNGATFCWHIGNFFDSLSRFAVPIFVMISGSLLLDQDIRLKVFLKKRYSKIVVPFIFWSVVYWLFNVFLTIRRGDDLYYGNVFFDFIYRMFVGSSYHLWYVYMIMGLFLFVPIIRPWVQSASNRQLCYFLCVWVIVLVLNSLNFSSITRDFNLGYFGGYLGYLVLGYFVSKRLLLTRLSVPLAIFLTLIGFLTTLLGTAYLTSKEGTFTSTFYDYLSINVACFSLGIFLLARTVRIQNMPASRFFSAISENSYGIYLVHVLVLSMLSYLHIDYQTITPILGIFLTSLLCLLLSLSIILFIKKIPFGKVIVA